MSELKTKLKDIEINKKTAIEIFNTSSKILKIIYAVVIILAIYVISLLLKEWGILSFLVQMLKILSPFFIGLLIAWLLDPFVRKLTQKGMKRIFATIMVFTIFTAILILIVSSIVPMLWNQVNDFIGTVPGIIGRVNDWINNIFLRFSGSEIYDLNSLKTTLAESIQDFGGSLTTHLPAAILNTAAALVSGFGLFTIGLLIAFYMLFDFEEASKGLFKLIPYKIRSITKEILHDINTSLRAYVQGILIISSILFVGTSIAFWAIGLEAPLLFGLICGVTNIIPYVGPYIGGAPAALVAFAQSSTTGILAIVLMFIIQFIEGNVLQPIIMGKTMKIHPVLIIIGLLVFGSLFGIVGMILATPLIAIGKIIIKYVDRKYNFLEKKLT